MMVIKHVMSNEGTYPGKDILLQKCPQLAIESLLLAGLIRSVGTLVSHSGSSLHTFDSFLPIQSTSSFIM